MPRDVLERLELSGSSVRAELGRHGVEEREIELSTNYAELEFRVAKQRKQVDVK